MKKMYAILSLILSLILAAIIPCAVLAENSSTVYLHLKLNRNVICACRPVEIYMDGTYIGCMEQGDLATVAVVLSNGYHQITFREKDWDWADDCTWTLSALPDGSMISCTVQTHELYVEIKDNKVTTGDGTLLMYDNTTERQQGYVIKIIDAIFN